MQFYLDLNTDTMLQAPKYMQWKPQLTPLYSCDYNMLITSGCSFTASTNQLQSAASWPGFLKDRLGLELCIDMSFPGAGNQYIKDSVLDAVINRDKKLKPLVIVMWSGIDRTEQILESNETTYPLAKVGSQYYKRTSNNFSTRELARQNLLYMMEVDQYLNKQKIDHVFTTYINMTEPTTIPVRDTTPTFYENLNTADEIQLKELPFIITGNRCLYEHAFLNNYTGDDMYHPPVEANLHWTDNVLSKELCVRGFINEIHS